VFTIINTVLMMVNT